MTKSTNIHVLGLCGSLRTGSLNGSLLDAAAALATDELTISRWDLSPIPLYNEDVRAEGYPAPVAAFRGAVAAADAVLIATPEYNYSIPGVLKNAIDWASRPPDQPFGGKPVAIMGAGPGRLGTVRAQYHLRQILLALDAAVLRRPEVMVAGAQTIFAEDGSLADQATEDHIARLLEALAGAIHARPRQRWALREPEA